jgi:hypothetical protein
MSTRALLWGRGESEPGHSLGARLLALEPRLVLRRLLEGILKLVGDTMTLMKYEG